MFRDRYADGLWYEASTGDFVRIEHDEEAEEVIFHDEDGTELDRIDPVDFEPSEYYRIPQEVIDDPIAFLEDRLERFIDGYYGRAEDNYTTFREEKSMKYAVEHTDLIEASGE